jgi:hypothetical protein
MPLLHPLVVAMLTLAIFEPALAQSLSGAAASSPMPSTPQNLWQLSIDQTIALSVGLLQVLAIVTVAFVVYRQTTRLKSVEMAKQLNDAYNLVTTIALTRDENLLAFDSIGRDLVDEPIEVRRKRWCAFIWLVALENTFMMNKHQLVDVKYADQALKHQLDLILSDDLIYDIICERGYEPAFVDYCRGIRENIERTRNQRGESSRRSNRQQPAQPTRSK